LCASLAAGSISGTGCSNAYVDALDRDAERIERALDDITDLLRGEDDDADDPRASESKTTQAPPEDRSRTIQVVRNGQPANADFFAIEEFDGRWRPIAGDDGDYRFTLEGDGDFQWIVVCVGNDGVPHGYYKNHHARFYPALLLEPLSLDCQHDAPTRRFNVTGSISGEFNEATVTIGDRSATVAAASPAFTIPAKPGVREALIRGTDVNGAPKITVIRDLTINGDTDLGAIDFAGLRDPVRKSAKYQYAGILPGSYDPAYRGMEVRFMTRGGTDALVGRDSNRDGDLKFDALPADLRRDPPRYVSDYYVFTVAGGDLDDPNDERAHVFVSTDPEDGREFYQLPNKLRKPTFDDTATLRLSWRVYDSGILSAETLLPYVALVYVLDLSRDHLYDWNVDLALPEADTVNGELHFAFPDLQGVDGWQPEWAPDGVPDSWSFTAYSGDVYALLRLLLLLDDDLTGAAARRSGP
jgi:hypothetical protein